jgi:hypothetical protein
MKQLNRHYVAQGERNLSSYPETAIPLNAGLRNNLPLPPVQNLDMSNIGTPGDEVLTAGFSCLDSFAAFSDDATTMAPSSTTGNSSVDAISGILAGTVPLSNVSVTTQSGTISYQSLMEQYLQGNLPGYSINTKTGTLEPTNSSALPTAAVVIGVGALVYWLFMRK